MATNFSDLYGVMRVILGDREVHGSYKYSTSALESALRSVFLLGQGPTGYALVGSPYSATAVTPELPLGNPCALVIYLAVLNLVGGEDGAYSYTTRPLSVRDGGERKRDLLWELRQRVDRIQETGFVFDCYQSLAQYLGSLPADSTFLQPALQSGNVEVRPLIGDLTF